ncbi:MAG: hypothetical protein U0800_16825 [Isosphaeraceae bacterium]
MNRLETELSSCGIQMGDWRCSTACVDSNFLNLSGNPGVTPSGLRHLRTLRSLNRLEIDGHAAEGDGLEEIQGVPKLHHLVLTEIGATPARVPLRLERLESSNAWKSTGPIAEMRGPWPSNWSPASAFCR